MKEIIFWFSNNDIRRHWFKYAVDYINKNSLQIKCNKVACWIKFNDLLKINFKVSSNNEMLDLAGRWDINQYWVEELFDNSFEEYFWTFIREELIK